jgi:PAS domain S-box-containing protein
LVKNTKKNIEERAIRKKAEERIKSESGPKNTITVSSQLKLLHELQIQQIEMKIQNEELMSTKEQLETALNRYYEFYDFAPIGYFTFNHKGIILEANLTGANLLQVERSRLVGKRFDSFVSDTTLQTYIAMLKKVFSHKTSASCQAELKASDGDKLFVHIQCSAPLENVKCLAVITDLTDLKSAEEARHSSDERFRIISTSTPDHIVMQDMDLRYTFVLNPQLGLTDEDMIGKTDFDILNSKDARHLTEIKRKVMRTLSPEHVKLPLTDKNGDVNYFEGSYVPVRNSQGIVNGLIGYFRNITGQVRVQNELSQTKNYLEKLINYANAPIIVWNQDQEIIRFNRAFEHLTGFSADEVLGRNIDFLFPEKTVEISKEKIKHTLKGDFWESIEIPILCKDGETKIILWNSANIYESDNKTLVSTIAQGNDITSRKMAENALEDSTRKLNLALENGNIGIWEFDIRKEFLSFDERMKRMTGFDKDTFDGSLKTFLNQIVEEDVNHVLETFRRSAGSSNSFEAIFRIKRDISTINHLMAKGMVYRDPEKTPRILGVCFDITKMKQDTDQALIRLTEELARSNRELEQFAYIASHDLQEPLRMISSFTQLLEKKYGEKLDQDGREYIKFAVDGSQRMYNLINDLLAFSRVTTKGNEFSGIEVNKVLSEVKKNLKDLIEKRSVSMTAGNMPTIYADRSQIVQLFQNLISNAIKFSIDKPEIQIHSSLQDDHHLFKIKDNGIGIDPQYFDRIFQIFQRLHPSDMFEGTGIGLAICRRIVERHLGKIWVESSPGKGATFLFTIKRDLK